MPESFSDEPFTAYERAKLPAKVAVNALAEPGDESFVLGANKQNLFQSMRGTKAKFFYIANAFTAGEILKKIKWGNIEDVTPLPFPTAEQENAGNNRLSRRYSTAILSPDDDARRHRWCCCFFRLPEKNKSGVYPENPSARSGQNT